jgi:hypothetical protein
MPSYLQLHVHLFVVLPVSFHSFQCQWHCIALLLVLVVGACTSVSEIAGDDSDRIHSTEETC